MICRNILNLPVPAVNLCASRTIGDPAINGFNLHNSRGYGPLSVRANDLQDRSVMRFKLADPTHWNHYMAYATICLVPRWLQKLSTSLRVCTTPCLPLSCPWFVIRQSTSSQPPSEPLLPFLLLTAWHLHSQRLCRSVR